MSHSFYCNALKSKTKHEIETFEVLLVATNFIKERISSYDSQYKRDKKIFRNELYVPPQETAIGTRWEMKKNKQTYTALPKHIQSRFSFVPITQQLKSLFSRQHFRDLYMNYNNSELENVKHKCCEGKFIDYCCGELYKKTNYL